MLLRQRRRQRRLRLGLAAVNRRENVSSSAAHVVRQNVSSSGAGSGRTCARPLLDGQCGSRGRRLLQLFVPDLYFVRRGYGASASAAIGRRGNL